MTMILIFGLAFIVPLILILIFLKWRYIWSMSFLITIFVVYQLYSIRIYGDGIGQAFAELFIWLIAGGLLFGIIVKSILSLFSQDTNRVRTNIIIGLSMILVSIIVGNIIYDQWDDRAPEKTCLLKRISITIENKHFFIPFLNDYEVIDSEQNNYFLAENKNIRNFCEDENINKSVNMIYLAIRPSNGKFFMHKEQIESYAFQKKLKYFEKESYTEDSKYPALIEIFSKEKYLGTLGTTQKDIYSNFLYDLKDKNSSMTQREIGNFYVHNNQYWVTKDRNWKNDASQPFTLECVGLESQTGQCDSFRILYELMPNVLVKYTIPASSIHDIDELDKVVKTMDAGVHCIIDELSKP